MAAAPPLPKQVGGGCFTYNRFHGTRPALPVIVGPPTTGKENKEIAPEKRETRRAKTHPVPQHAARLAWGPFLLPHGLPGAYPRVASTSISASPVAWAGGVPTGRSSPL